MVTDALEAIAGLLGGRDRKLGMVSCSATLSWPGQHATLAVSRVPWCSLRDSQSHLIRRRPRRYSIFHVCVDS